MRNNTANSTERKAYIITGPTSGIGQASAFEVAKQSTAILVGRNPAKLSEVQKAIEQKGGHSVSVKCDLSDMERVRRAAAEIVALDLPIGGLLNNAGISPMRPAKSVQGWDLRVPLVGTWRRTRLHAAFGEIETEHGEFSENAWSAPRGFLSHHLEDQLTDFLGHRPSADRFTHARDQPPIELKAGSVPAHHGIRRHDNERCFPARSEATKKHPKNLICDDQLGARIPAFENRELLTQSKILDEEPLLRAKQSNK